ncbi:transposase [Paraburkholderia humisilvae]|uniref:transposase n=1 Tax=Paraburkholderia humisilvae TaxID=627669 RepID=UPI001FE27A66|nr:transposase [Paraburkholderia humisilvae]
MGRLRVAFVYVDGNHRNVTSARAVITPGGELKLDIPRDRQATFEPQLVASINAGCRASMTTSASCI